MRFATIGILAAAVMLASCGSPTWPVMAGEAGPAGRPSTSSTTSTTIGLAPATADAGDTTSGITTTTDVPGWDGENFLVPDGCAAFFEPSGDPGGLPSIHVVSLSAGEIAVVEPGETWPEIDPALCKPTITATSEISSGDMSGGDLIPDGCTILFETPTEEGAAAKRYIIRLPEGKVVMVIEPGVLIPEIDPALCE